MTAMRDTTPLAPPLPGQTGPAPAHSGGGRRPGRTTRSVSAAGQARRSAQRDLARREASLRINRRVSGPVEGLSRPQAAVPQTPVAPPLAAPARPAMPPMAMPAPPMAPAQAPLAGQAPARRQAPARPQAPAARQAPPQRRVEASPEPASFVTTPASAGARRAPQGQAGPQAQGQAGPQAQPQRASAPAPAPRRAASPLAMSSAPMRPQPIAAGPAPAMAAAPRLRPATVAAAAAAALPSRLPIAIPRPKLTALPGGLVETAPTGRNRLSTPAVMVTAITILVLTVGCILGLQIRKTQLNEAMGTELGAIQQTQQAVTRQQEQNSQLAAGAKIAGYSSGRMIQPDVKDVTFAHSGSRAATAQRALEVLKRAPKAPTDAELAAAAAAAKAEAVTAGTGAVATTDTAAAGTTTEATVAP